MLSIKYLKYKKIKIMILRRHNFNLIKEEKSMDN